MEERKVTIRLEGEIPEETPHDGGGSPPEIPPKDNLLQMRKTKEICWPCVLVGVGIVIVAIASIWMELTDIRR